MEIGNEPGQIPEIILKNPPRRLFAYINSHPDDQVMGVTIDGKTGQTIQAVILPTRQRVMLGLGIGNDDANAHHTYRQKYPSGYTLLWTDNPDTDPRLAGLKGRLEESADANRKQAPHAEGTAPPPPQREPDAVETHSPIGELTTKLVRAGAEGAKPTHDSNRGTDAAAIRGSQNARDPTPPVPEQQNAGDTGKGIKESSHAPGSYGGFF